MVMTLTRDSGYHGRGPKLFSSGFRASLVRGMVTSCCPHPALLAGVLPLGLPVQCQLPVVPYLPLHDFFGRVSPGLIPQASVLLSTIPQSYCLLLPSLCTLHGQALWCLTQCPLHKAWLGPWLRKWLL